jgi:hypothetical protein
MINVKKRSCDKKGQYRIRNKMKRPVSTEQKKLIQGAGKVNKVVGAVPYWGWDWCDRIDNCRRSVG